MTSRHIAVIGGGYSGTLQAIELLRYTNARISLIERAERPARGVAYGTRHADHLLNVRAEKMSAFACAPDHFANWLQMKGLGSSSSFAERRVYGSYLEELLSSAVAESEGRLRILKADAVALTRGEATESIRLKDGRRIEADLIILSIGNLPPARPRVVPDDLEDDVYIADPWAGDVSAGLQSSDEVLLVGTGLTAIDAALMLDAAGFQGRVTALSRRGLVPRAHQEDSAEAPSLCGPVPEDLSDLLRFVRRQSAEIGWIAAVDQLRPCTQWLWASASVKQRRRFLRHLRPYWDVHRHRIAPRIGARIDKMVEEGRLRFGAGKLLSIEPLEEGAQVAWRPRGSGAAKALPVRRIVNCTGPDGNIARAEEPLLQQLFESGRIRPDSCRIGIDVDSRCRTIGGDGEASPTLYAIGPMTRGALWEIVAVPDIREQTLALAKQLADQVEPRVLK